MSLSFPTDAQIGADEVLRLTWSNGRTLHYAPDTLRARCPCAHCQPNPAVPVQRFREDHPDVRIKVLEQIGNYALRIGFSDGHEIGIYTFERLESLGCLDQKDALPPPRASAFDV